MMRTSVRGWTWRCSMLVLLPLSLLPADDRIEQVRKEILKAYQQSLDALQRGDADAALQIDTRDWVSITAARSRGHARRWSRSSGGISRV